MKGTRDRLENQLIQTKLVLGKVDETMREIAETVESYHSRADPKSRSYQDRNLTYDRMTYEELQLENNTLRAEIIRLQDQMMQNEQIAVQESEIARNEMSLIVAETRRLQDTVQQLKLRSSVSNVESPDSRRSSPPREDSPLGYRDSWLGPAGRTAGMLHVLRTLPVDFTSASSTFTVCMRLLLLLVHDDDTQQVSLEFPPPLPPPPPSPFSSCHSLSFT